MKCSQCKEVPLICDIEIKRGVCLMCNPTFDVDPERIGEALERIESKLDKLLEDRE